MAPKLTSVAQQTPEQIIALAESERTRSHQNDKTIKQIAQKFLGHVYNKETHKIEEMAVENFQDETVVRDHSESLYVATLDAATDIAVDRLNNRLGFNIDATVGSSPVKIGAGLDVGQTKSKSSDSSTVVCAVACVKKDRCGFQKTPKRLPVTSQSIHLGIIKSIWVYAGYRVVLEIISSSNKSEKKTTVDVKAEGSTLSTILGGKVQVNHENSSLSDRNIEQINIKEIFSFGGYRVPHMKIPAGNDFPKIQEMFESIREHFQINYYSLVDRHILVNPHEDLVQLREMALPNSEAPYLVPSEVAFLKTLITPRNSDYYIGLAKEILSLLSDSELGYRGPYLHLELMLYGIEISFSNLLNLPNKRAPVLLVGTDPSTIRLQGVRLVGGKAQERKRLYPNGRSESFTEYEISGEVLANDFVPDVFNPALNANSSRIYTYGNVLETPILSPGIPSEYNICLGVATDFVISHFTPRKIIVCIPRDFFRFSSSSDLVKKMNSLYQSLRRIVYNPISCTKSVLFAIDDQPNNRKEYGVNIYEELVLAANELDAERAKRETKGRSLAAWVANLWKSYDSVAEKKALTEIMEAFEAYNFIVDRLVMSSQVNDVLNGKKVKKFAICSKFDVPHGYLSYKSTNRRHSSYIKLVDLPIDEFDRDNITLSGFSYFENVLTIALRYMRYIENKVANLNSQSLTSIESLKSYDRILNLLTKQEFEKIDKIEAEESLGKAVAEELEKWTTKKQEKEKEIGINTKNIEEKTVKIQEWKKDRTPTPLKLTPDQPITMRSFWHLPPFGKEYTFQTSFEFSKCEFRKTHGSFNCTEAEFKNTKKAQFTPQHWGYEKDLRANIMIWMEKRKHPDTLKDIDNYNSEIKQLQEKEKSLQQELKDINTTINELAAKNIVVIENRLIEKRSAFSNLVSELDKFRSNLIQHHEYYEILKGIHNLQLQRRDPSEDYSIKTPKLSTNYYGLSPINSFIPGTRYIEEEHSPIRALSEQTRRPIYLITPGNQSDKRFGTHCYGAPLFFEYDGQDYRGLEPSDGQKAQEIAKEIESKSLRG